MTQTVVQELAGKSRLILLCGRYEGFDERISLGLQPDEISVGDFIVNGGEVPAMVIIESVMRLIPGVLGDETSSKYESFAEAGMLEYPQYTRPREYRGMTVPEVLLTGNHQEIEKWRERAAYERTVERREDLAGKLPPLPEPKRKKVKKKKQTNELPATGPDQTAASAPAVDIQKTEPPKTTDEPLT